MQRVGFVIAFCSAATPPLETPAGTNGAKFTSGLPVAVARLGSEFCGVSVKAASSIEVRFANACHVGSVSAVDSTAISPRTNVADGGK